MFFRFNGGKLGNYRGTQRICSSHYLFPRVILLAGKNTGVSMSWLGNFVIDRGFAWELLTFSSISTRAGKHTTAGQSDCACRKNLFCPGLSLLFGRFGSRDLKARGIPGWEINLIIWLGNQPIYLAGWEISCVSRWEKGTDNVFPATLKNT